MNTPDKYDGEMVSRTLRYYQPGIVVKGVVWCAEVPGREPIWSRTLCMALELSRKDPKRVIKPTTQINLFA